MMKHNAFKTLMALCLCLVLTAGLLPAHAAYPDVQSGELELAAATLTSLGVFNGYPDGAFHPNDGLDRGQFCKLAILVGGYGEQLTPSSYQTVFDDVPPSHWASTYINLACSLGLVSGYGNGRFGPNDPVTLGQAAKVLLGLLGYTTEDVGPFFPEDYLTRAASLGLTEGLSSQDVPLTRGDAALLLYRLLRLQTKEGTPFYARLAQSALDDVVLLDAQTVTVTDGKSIQDYSADVVLDSALVGRRGVLLRDKKGLVCGFVPEEDDFVSLTVAAAEADAITAENGQSYELDEGVAVILDDELTVYGNAWFSLRAGDRVALYKTGGEVSLVVVNLQAHTAGNQLVGRLEDASPNLRRPTSVTVQGAKLEVTDQGRKALSAFSIGDTVKVTLDRAGKIADAAPASGESNVGLLTVNGDRASLTLPGATLSGALADSGSNVSSLAGSLVRAKVNTEGELSVSALTAQSYSTSLNVAERTFGNTTLASDAVLYERVGSAPVQAVSLSDILTPIVAAEDIEYVGYNAAGEVNLLLLQNVTGNCYTYGKLIKGTKTSGSGQMTATNTTVTVENSDNDTTAWVVAGTPFQSESFGGVAKNPVTGKATVISLTPVEGLTRSDFSGSNTLAGIPIAGNVQVYNAATGRWITLAQAKAYSDSFTAYFDRAVETGGQVRVIVAEG